MSQQESQMIETIVEEHLKEALGETNPVEKNYHIRSALQRMVSEEMSGQKMSSNR
ncbi:hypothetical protein [Halorubrum halophilum]|uniref:hypothetical protein n=1 Tax=Halorubrum halophilum TaxID=413816 RepID=UPI00186AC825|nr:hypothetical protein [Halorubrum halophilum]